MSPDQLEAILQPRRSQPHQLVEALQDVQELYGYIPEDVAMKVSDELGVPPIEVYRVATFYKAFSLTPQGDTVIRVCTGTACHIRGAGQLVEELGRQLSIGPDETTDDMRFTLKTVNCVGACAMAPVVSLNGAYHGSVQPGSITKLIQGGK